MPVLARTPALEAFAAPARARPALWRTIAGATLAGGLWIAAIVAGLLLAGPPQATPAAILLFLASFAALLAGTALSARLLQGRRPRTLIGPDGFRARHFALGVAVIVAATLPALPFAPPLVRQLPLAVWAAWLLPGLAAVLVQTTAEEVLFRGFLLQSLAARFRSPLAWAVLPSVAFGLLHWNPAELGPNAWLGVVGPAAVGLVLADVTARTGNLSAAIGLHFANNVVALLVVAVPSPVSGLALMLFAVAPPDAAAMRALLLADLASTLVGWAAWRGVLALGGRQGNRI